MNELGTQDRRRRHRDRLHGLRLGLDGRSEADGAFRRGRRRRYQQGRHVREQRRVPHRRALSLRRWTMRSRRPRFVCLRSRAKGMRCPRGAAVRRLRLRRQDRRERVLGGGDAKRSRDRSRMPGATRHLPLRLSLLPANDVLLPEREREGRLLRVRSVDLRGAFVCMQRPRAEVSGGDVLDGWRRCDDRRLHGAVIRSRPR